MNRCSLLKASSHLSTFSCIDGRGNVERAIIKGETETGESRVIDEARSQKRGEGRHQENGEKVWPWKESMVKEENRGCLSFLR